jgi:hypothetical protein
VPVLNFTQKSDKEVQKAFADPANQPCGLYRKDQIAPTEPLREHCASSYSNTWKVISFVMAGALAGEGCVEKHQAPFVVAPQVQQASADTLAIATTPPIVATPITPTKKEVGVKGRDLKKEAKFIEVQGISLGMGRLKEEVAPKKK